MRSRNNRHGPAANQLDLLSFRAAFRLVRFVFGEGPGGLGGIFPWGQQAGATVRKRRREMSGRLGSRVEYTIQTCDPSVSRTAVRWGPQFSSSAPPRSPAPSFDHFPFGPGLRPWSFSFRPIMRFLVIVILYVTASAFKGLHRIFFEIQQPTVRCDKCKYLVASYLW